MKIIERDHMLDSLTALSRSLVTVGDEVNRMPESPKHAIHGMVADLISAANEIDDDEEFRTVTLLTYLSLRAWWTVVVSRAAYQFGVGEKSVLLHDKADVFGDALCILEEFLDIQDVDNAVSILALANSSNCLSTVLQSQSEIDFLHQSLNVTSTADVVTSVVAMRQQLQTANSKVKRLTFALGRRSPYAERAAIIASAKHRQRSFGRSSLQLMTTARHKRLGLAS